ncbi:putative 2-aminoethylphosphonate ABC transporter, ATP-binding protein [compost metagenome]
MVAASPCCGERSTSSGGNMKNTTKSDDYAVDIRAVRKAYGAGESAFVALDNATVSVRENEFFTLLGPSGCGKTTLLRMIAGFDYPTSGEILLNGSDITSLPPFKRPVNTVFQSYALFPHMTVAENVAFGLEALGKPRAEVRARDALEPWWWRRGAVRIPLHAEASADAARRGFPISLAQHRPAGHPARARVRQAHRRSDAGQALDPARDHRGNRDHRRSRGNQSRFGWHIPDAARSRTHRRDDAQRRHGERPEGRFGKLGRRHAHHWQPRGVATQRFRAAVPEGALPQQMVPDRRGQLRRYRHPWPMALR